MPFEFFTVKQEGGENVNKSFTLLQKHLSSYKAVFNKIADNYYEEQKKRAKIPSDLSDTEREFAQSFTVRGSSAAEVQISDKVMTITSKSKQRGGVNKEEKLFVDTLIDKKIRDGIPEGVEFRSSEGTNVWEGPKGKREVGLRGNVTMKVAPAPITDAQKQVWTSFLKQYANADFVKKMKEQQSK